MWFVLGILAEERTLAQNFLFLTPHQARAQNWNTIAKKRLFKTNIPQLTLFIGSTASYDHSTTTRHRYQHVHGAMNSTLCQSLTLHSHIAHCAQLMCTDTLTLFIALFSLRTHTHIVYRALILHTSHCEHRALILTLCTVHCALRIAYGAATQNQLRSGQNRVIKYLLSSVYRNKYFISTFSS